MLVVVHSGDRGSGGGGSGGGSGGGRGSCVAKICFPLTALL